jgi:hypothetical protein
MEQPPLGSGPLPEPAAPPAPSRGRLIAFAGVCVALALGSIAYRALVVGHIEQTSMMFIGLPTLIAIFVAAIPTGKSVTGLIMKTMTLFFLLLAVLLIEGAICILMAAPLFYSIGLLVGVLVDRARVRKDIGRMRLIVFPVLAIMSLEGISETLSFPRDEVITISRQLELPLAAARAQLAVGPSFQLTELPSFLKAGFPAPKEIQGNGLELGNTWRIHFAGGEGKPGDLQARVVESSPNRIRVARTTDTSHIAHWLDWQDATWELQETASGGTQLTLTMRYRRLLDPAWYFKPIERYGVRKAGEYFLDQTFRAK